MGRAVPGWASIICIICFLSGIQLLALGVIGEYIGKIYMEVKARPRYIISERDSVKCSIKKRAKEKRFERTLIIADILC